MAFAGSESSPFALPDWTRFDRTPAETMITSPDDEFAAPEVLVRMSSWSDLVEG